jgi:hypothetical protein
LPFLYWYDTQQASTTTTALDYTVRNPFLTLDDKRATQPQSNDILLFYTKTVPSTTQFDLYMLRQRDRFNTEVLLQTNTPPYIHKVGMTDELRLQVGMTYVPAGEVGLLIRSTLGSLSAMTYNTDINAIRNLVSTLDTFTFIEHRQIVIKPGDIVSVGGALVITEHQSNVNWIKNVISTYESAAFVEYLSKITPTSLVSLPDTLTLSEHDSIARAYIDLHVTSDYDTLTLTAYESKVTDPSDNIVVSNRDRLFFYRWPTTVIAYKFIISNNEQLSMVDYDSKVTPLSILTKNFGSQSLTSYDTLIIQYLNQIVSTYDTLTATTYRAIIGYGSNFSNFVPVTLTPHDATVTGTTIYRINSNYEPRVLTAYESDYAGLVFFGLLDDLLVYTPLHEGYMLSPTDLVGTYSWEVEGSQPVPMTQDSGIFGANTATSFNLTGFATTASATLVGTTTKSMAFSFWVKFNDASGWEYPLGQGPYSATRWAISAASSGNIRLDIRNASNSFVYIDSGVTRASLTGTYGHVFVRWDHETQTASISINGNTPVTQVISGMAGTQYENKLRIADGYNQGGNLSMCEVAIWNGTSLSDEIGLWLYNNGNGRWYEKVAAYREGVSRLVFKTYKSTVELYSLLLTDDLDAYVPFYDGYVVNPEDKVGTVQWGLYTSPPTQPNTQILQTTGILGDNKATQLVGKAYATTTNPPYMASTAVSMTFSAWIRFDDTSGTEYAFGQGANLGEAWGVGAAHGGNIFCMFRDATEGQIYVYSDVIRASNTWYHVFGKWNHQTRRFSIRVNNGATVDGPLNSPYAGYANSPILILAALGASFGNVSVSDVAIWRGVAQPDSVGEWFYNDGSGRYYAEVEAYRGRRTTITLIPHDSVVTFIPGDITYRLISYLPLYEGDVANPTDEVGTYTWSKNQAGTFTKEIGLFGEDTATYIASDASYHLPDASAPLMFKENISSSLSVWAKWPDASGDDSVIGQGQYTTEQWKLSAIHGQTIRFYFDIGTFSYDAYVDSGVNRAQNTWYHIFVTWNHLTDTVRISVNGNPIRSTITSDISNGGGTFNDHITVGYAWSSSATITASEIALWNNVALPDEFGTWLYNSGSGRSWQGMLAYPGNGILSNRGVQALTAYDSDVLLIQSVTSGYDTLTLTAFDSVVTGGSGGGSLLDESGSAILHETNNPILEE